MKRYMLCKIKPGKTQDWLDWCNEINLNHRHEGVLSLKEENLIFEKCTILQTLEYGDFVIYEHQTKGQEKKMPANMDRELNVKHFKIFHECLEVVKSKNIAGYSLTVE